MWEQKKVFKLCNFACFYFRRLIFLTRNTKRLCALWLECHRLKEMTRKKEILYILHRHSALIIKWCLYWKIELPILSNTLQFDSVINIQSTYLRLILSPLFKVWDIVSCKVPIAFRFFQLPRLCIPRPVQIPCRVG